MYNGKTSDESDMQATAHGIICSLLGLSEDIKFSTIYR